MTDRQAIPNELLDSLGEAPLSQLILAWLATRTPATTRQPNVPRSSHRAGAKASTPSGKPRSRPHQRSTCSSSTTCPRTALTTKEVAEVTGLPYDRILKEIRTGRIRVITGGQAYVIPITELIEINKWAEYLDPLA